MNKLFYHREGTSLLQRLQDSLFQRRQELLSASDFLECVLEDDYLEKEEIEFLKKNRIAAEEIIDSQSRIDSFETFTRG